MYNEIDKLVTLSKKGDRNAKERLLISLKPLVLSSIRRYYNCYSQYDDLLQEGYEIILRTVEDYDESKGSRFLGYLKLQLKYHYLNKHKEKIILSLNETLDDEEEFIDLLEDKGFGPLDTIINKEEKEILFKGLSYLSNRQVEVLIYYYIQKMTMVEISEKLGLSYRTVVNTKTKAVDKLKNIINKNI